MDYASLIAEFGARYGMNGLAPDENGAVGIEVDGRMLVLQRQEGTDIVIATLDLGITPPAGAAMTNRLQRLNTALFVQDGMMIGLSESGGYRLFFRFDVATLDFIDFDERIARLLDRAEQWGGLLEQLGTLLAAAGTSGDTTSADSFPPPGLDATLGLLRV